MTKARSEALERLVQDIEEFKIDWQQYFDDLEPQSIYDSALSGKLEALARFCGTLGWSELAEPLREMVPLRCSALEVLECRISSLRTG